jgi:pimeloyl-ACP methyl ester carboxylesterase
MRGRDGAGAKAEGRHFLFRFIGSRVQKTAGEGMTISRRRFVGGVAAIAVAADSSWSSAFAQIGAAPVPPIVFAHGNGDHAALWMTTLWRMESNGIATDRMHAINFTDPLARSDDATAQPNRSSTEDQRNEFARAVAGLKQRTGAQRVAAVANSRGGYAIRNYVAGGGTDVSHAVLCGVPNHGVFNWEDSAGSEFNGRGPFLTKLNSGEVEVTPGTEFLTLRSDTYDKFAQPDGRFVGKAGTPTGVTFEGPALRGATNLVLDRLDHREVAFHPRAFREIFRFIAGREPERLDIVPLPRVRLSGLVTGLVGGAQTNRPVAGASVEVFRVSPESGERLGAAVHASTTAADGAWGAAEVEPTSSLEIVLRVEGSPTTHYYRSPFPRSSSVLHLRPGRALSPAEAGVGAVVLMTRPRGYFGLPRDVVLLNGKEPTEVAKGVPGDATATVRLPENERGRPVVALFNQERIVARAWPASENRITIAELTY